MEVEQLVAAVRGQPERTLLGVDFDGTLAPIVADPDTSRPVPGAVDALVALARRGTQIAVLTGRDARTVLALGGLAAIPGLVVEGLYGAETWHDGELSTPRTPPQIDELRRRLPGVVDAGGAGRIWIEDKRLSLVVHGRLAEDPEAALAPLRAPVAELATELGLEVHPGRGIIEVRLPGFDKAAALARLVARVAPHVVIFAGDDLGDLPAFAHITALRARGLAAWGIGVVSAEVPEVADAADVHVGGPGAFVELLRALAA